MSRPPGPANAAREARFSAYWLMAVMSVLMAFASISTDLYLPAMPAMARDLGMAPGLAAMTVSTYLVGFSLGQLAWGPLSDRWGRRVPLMAGLVVFTAGSAGCALAASGQAIVAWRAVQALGACESVVIARAMVRDRFDGPQGAQVMSTLMTVMAVAPLLGPSVGSAVLASSGSWRAIFWILVVTGLSTAAAVWTVPETLPLERRPRTTMTAAFLNYGTLVRRPRLIAFAGVLGFFYAATFAYIAASPFVYITNFHLSPAVYALIFASGIVGLMATNVVNRRVVTRLGSVPMLRVGAAGACVAAVFLLLGASLHLPTPWFVVLPSVAFVSTTGFIVANAITAALAEVPHMAGTASALLGAIQYGGGMVGAAAVGAFADNTPLPMAVVMCAAAAGAAGCAWSLRSAVTPAYL